MLLVVRGSSNWSRGFAVTWYGLLVVGSVCSLFAVVDAALRRRRSVKQRLTIVVMSLPALLAASAISYIVFEVVPNLD
jgi:prolipoprotein diacylglyceryltransferase